MPTQKEIKQFYDFAVENAAEMMTNKEVRKYGTDHPMHNSDHAYRNFLEGKAVGLGRALGYDYTKVVQDIQKEVDKITAKTAAQQEHPES